MANTFTLKQLRDSARRRADMEGSRFVPDDEIDDYINDGGSELHDLLLLRYKQHYRSKFDIKLRADQEEYDLPTDFHQLLSVFFLEGIGTPVTPRLRYKLEMFMLDELTEYEVSRVVPIASGEHMRYRLIGAKIFFTPRPNLIGDIEMWYTPQYKRLIEDDDPVTIQILNGWEEYYTNHAAIQMLSKEESDTGYLERRKRELVSRITVAAQTRDAGRPQRVRDVYAERNLYPRRRRLY